MWFLDILEQACQKRGQKLPGQSWQTQEMWIYHGRGALSSGEVCGLWTNGEETRQPSFPYLQPQAICCLPSAIQVTQESLRRFCLSLTLHSRLQRI